MADDDSSSDDEVGFGMLFKTTYELKGIDIQDHRYELLVSPAASTDYDKTGEILWPAAYSLANWISANAHLLQKGGTFLELGAGMGLPSMVLLHKQPPRLLIASDHQKSVLSVLEQNIGRQTGQPKDQPPSLATVWSTFRFEWGDAAHIQALRAAAARLLGQELPFEGFDYIIASDVVYSSDAIAGLLSSVKQLLRPSSGLFIMAHRTRWAQVDRALAAAWDEYGIQPAQNLPAFVDVVIPDDEKIFIQSIA